MATSDHGYGSTVAAPAASRSDHSCASPSRVRLGAMEHDLADLIRAQHAQMHGLLAQLGRQPAVTELVLGPQLRARRRVMRTVERTFLAQQAARLRHLWPALRRTWPDGRSYTGRAWARTRTIEYLMAKRRWSGERDAALTDLEDRIASGIVSLMATEARQLPRMEGPDDRTGLDGTSLAQRVGSEGLWPTRPHPDVPRSQRLASLVHRPLALADRVHERCGHTTE